MASVHVFLVGSLSVEQYQMKLEVNTPIVVSTVPAVHKHGGVCGSIDLVDLVCNVESITADTITCTCTYMCMYIYMYTFHCVWLM